jgi:ribosomal protein S18 acetylase RimI-like enzyme
MAVIVRRASTPDADLLSTLHADVQAMHAAALPSWFKPPGPDTFPPSAAAALLGRVDRVVFIAEIDRIAAGYAYAEVSHQSETPWRYAHDMFYVHQIGVLAAHRRRGAGAALVGALRLEADSRGIELLALDVWTFNEDAQAFFRRQGFMPYTERMWHR